MAVATAAEAAQQYVAVQLGDSGKERLRYTMQQAVNIATKLFWRNDDTAVSATTCTHDIFLPLHNLIVSAAWRVSLVNSAAVREYLRQGPCRCCCTSASSV